MKIPQCYRNSPFRARASEDFLPDSTRHEHGFTLIELSIVLVIIGLIIGGVLVGQDLIRAAEIRATLSQVEKYNTAVHTFQTKYNAIPGDMSSTQAVQFGFGTRAGTVGQGDGNGVLDGYNTAGNLGQGGQGETALFWVDVSSINLIDGQFNEAAAAAPVAVVATNIPSVLPPAKLGRNAYFYVYEVAGTNYYGLSSVSAIAVTSGQLTSTASLTEQQAYNIDKKADDGFPNSGNITAYFLTANAVTATSHASPAVAASCYDSTTTNGTYAVGVNNGLGANCALSFVFQ